MTWSMSRVIRSSVDRPSTGIAAASAAVRSMSARVRGAARRRRVLEPVGVALVAVERGGRRVELEDALPEPVGEVVDGARAWSVTEGALRCGARSGGAVAVAR